MVLNSSDPLAPLYLAGHARHSNGLALEQFDRNAFRRAQEGNAHARPHRRRPAGELDALRLEFGNERIDAVDREPE
jgi:hypothetical protein